MSNVYDIIRDPDHCFLIAEIGSNHNGDFETAVRLMKVAREANADAVKFQSFLADLLVTRDSPDYAMLKRVEDRGGPKPMWSVDFSRRVAVFDRDGLGGIAAVRRIQGFRTFTHQWRSKGRPYEALVRRVEKGGDS